MKRRLPLFLLLVVPFTAVAQQWSPEQQEVLDHIRACWDAWQTKDVDNWINVCRPADDNLVWLTNEGLPTNNPAYVRKIMGAQWKDVTYLWDEMRPIAVHIYGDVALVYMYALFSWTDDEEIVSRESKRLEVFRKVNGQWTLIGNMIHSLSQD